MSAEWGTQNSIYWPRNEGRREGQCDRNLFCSTAAVVVEHRKTRRKLLRKLLTCFWGHVSAHVKTFLVSVIVQRKLGAPCVDTLNSVKGKGKTRSHTKVWMPCRHILQKSAGFCRRDLSETYLGFFSEMSVSSNSQKMPSHTNTWSYQTAGRSRIILPAFTAGNGIDPLE